jgi:hypothetical protein
MDKIEKLRLKAKLAEESGNYQEAYNINKKIKGLIAKAKYKKAKGPSRFSKTIKKVKKKSKEIVNKVKEEIPVIKKKEEKPPVIKKKEENNPNSVSSGKLETSINTDQNKDKKDKVTKIKKTKTKVRRNTLSGTIGLAYGKDGKIGVGEVTKNGVTYKPGDEGFDEVSAEFIEKNRQRQERIDKYKKR